MIINPIKTMKAFYYANRPLKTSNPKPLVRIPEEMSIEMHNKIASNISRLEFASFCAGRPMTFAEKGKSTLMNFGSFTSVLDNNSSAKELARQMETHIKRVLKVF